MLASCTRSKKSPGGGKQYFDLLLNTSKIYAKIFLTTNAKIF